ncbi:GNAT family N-acetyltransferase [Jiangella asiatica]|uniref:N-acetyltransferase n=1 Tax=Jiangella asiatica TaxID=2530372 RepID=A0A4V2Z0B0_9ACTN|nr:N-acetyltransferase [Jiangella asiatica]TDE00278.1 N-acetyltransferase [Jiangella asiatica]
MELRPELPTDHDAVRDVHLAAFGDTGRLVADLTDDLRSLLPPAGSPMPGSADEARHGAPGELSDGGAAAGLSLVAVDGGRVVGHVMFTRSLLDAPKRLVDVLVLSPLGVLPGRQGRGVGTALVRRGLELLRGTGVPLVFLEGHPGYYSRLGFEPGGELGFCKPSQRIPDAAFQVHRLPAYRPWMTGTLVYTEIFWRHDAVGLR